MAYQLFLDLYDCNKNKIDDLELVIEIAHKAISDIGSVFPITKTLPFALLSLGCIVIFCNVPFFRVVKPVIVYLF